MSKKLISFDVFDTAIFRRVYKPTDIFDLVEQKVGKNFKKLRLEAQSLARKQKQNYNLSDIYQFLPQFDKKVELAVELENCYANPEILKIYNSGEYDCVFISDMYLSAYQIANILIKCGYKNPKVYSSSTCNALKYDGSLFEYVKYDLDREIYKHYGDNYNADINGAKKAQIKKVCFLPNIENTKTLTPTLDNSLVQKLQTINELSDNSLPYKIGYLWGASMYEYTKWILDSATDEQTIFFNARDSFAPYLIARYILKTQKHIKYCRLSRRSSVLPNTNFRKHLNHPVNVRQFNILRYARADKLSEFLKANRIYRYDYSKIYEVLGIKDGEDMCITPFVCDQALYEKFILAIEPIIYERIKQDKDNFLKYLNNLGMKNNDIFVDIGYNGTMQYATECITGYKLKGMYFQVLNGNANADYTTIEKHSFLKTDILRGHCGIAEVIFSEPVGSVTHYNDEGKPVIYGDSKSRKDIMKEIIRGVLQCARDMYINNISLSESDCRKLLGRFLCQPTIEECEFANTGIFENGAITKLESIVWFNRELIKKGELVSCYNRSYWREAFMTLLRNDNELSYLEPILIPPNIVDVLTKTSVKKLMENFRTYNKPFYFYGCSALANEIMRRFFWIKENPNFQGFIDQRANELKTFCGKPVYFIKDAVRRKADCEIYLTVLYQDMVRDQIGKQLVPILNIY